MWSVGLGDWTAAVFPAAVGDSARDGAGDLSGDGAGKRAANSGFSCRSERVKERGARGADEGAGVALWFLAL